MDQTFTFNFHGDQMISTSELLAGLWNAAQEAERNSRAEPRIFIPYYEHGDNRFNVLTNLRRLGIVARSEPAAAFLIMILHAFYNEENLMDMLDNYIEISLDALNDEYDIEEDYDDQLIVIRNENPYDDQLILTAKQLLQKWFDGRGFFLGVESYQSEDHIPDPRAHSHGEPLAWDPYTDYINLWDMDRIAKLLEPGLPLAFVPNE